MPRLSTPLQRVGGSKSLDRVPMHLAYYIAPRRTEQDVTSASLEPHESLNMKHRKFENVLTAAFVRGTDHVGLFF